MASAVLTHIATSLVDDPDAVHLSTSELRGRKVRLSLRVAPNDLGRLIGRRGRVAASIRTVVGAAATRDGLDVEVEFAE
ncbi:MAG: KH domain-containing protein [Acidimicrobiia bacterium]|nr:KH domain-containing protein [Acidimicrobiia bacterium]